MDAKQQQLAAEAMRIQAFNGNPRLLPFLPKLTGGLNAQVPAAYSAEHAEHFGEVRSDGVVCPWGYGSGTEHTGAGQCFARAATHEHFNGECRRASANRRGGDLSFARQY
jgi:hypothetical protein